MHTLLFGILSQGGMRNEIVSLVQIHGTDYYKFPNMEGYSVGPITLEGVPDIDQGLRGWRVIIADGVFKLQQYDSVEWVTKSEIGNNIFEEDIKHVSLTFDASGFPQIAFEKSDGIWMYWLDPTQGQVISLNKITEGVTPFVHMTSFNSYIDTNRQVYLYYIRDNKLCGRKHVERFSTEYIIKEDVSDILAVGTTEFGNVKIVYVDVSSEEPVVANIATERLGLFEADVAIASHISAEITEMAFEDPTVRETLVDGSNHTFEVTIDNVGWSVEDALVEPDAVVDGSNHTFEVTIDNVSWELREVLIERNIDGSKSDIPIDSVNHDGDLFTLTRVAIRVDGGNEYSDIPQDTIANLIITME